MPRRPRRINPVEAALEATRRRIASPGWMSDSTPPAPIGIEFDALQDDLDISDWSVTRRAAMTALRAIQPRHRVAVLSMARNEAPYLAEWIAHYLAIGTDRIFVYTNDNTDGTDELLRWFSNNAPVTPIFTTAATGVNIQRKNYAHALFLLPELRLYDWVVVVDADEFLVPAARFDHHLPTMLAAAPADTDAILFPWRWRLWDRAFERGPGLLAERYAHAYDHNSFKPVLRMPKVTSLAEVHAPTLERGGVIRDTEFRPIAKQEIWSEAPKSAVGGWIDHYWSKSFEEFIIKKRRGDSLALADDVFKRGYDEFFRWTSQATPENLSSVPETIVAAIKHTLTCFEAISGYGELRSKLDERYASYARGIRDSVELRRLYEDFSAQYRWLPSESP